jgi:DNA-binding MarR family transcriptional regulator
MVDHKYTMIGMQSNPKNACACLAVRKAARAITQFYDSYIQSFGVKPTQYSLLLAVYVANGVTISGLAHFMVMDRTTLTRNLKPLEKEGLLVVKPGLDKRTKMIIITRKGVNLLKKMTPAWESAQQELNQCIGNEKFRSLLKDMADIVEAIH